MDELEREWQTAGDGFPAGIDFKTWLANQVISLRAAAQQGVHLTALRSWLFGWFTGTLAGFGIAYYFFGSR